MAKYEIAWNTGDDECWDNPPVYEQYNSISEVEDAIGRLLTAEEVEELDNGFIVSDILDIEYEITRIK